jgi:hypothetical protein
MIDRRKFLKLGTGGALAAGLLPCGGAAQQEKPPLRRVKSVIWLWMGGGPSQLDTWDPKPDSPNAGGLKAIETAVPGIQVSELLPVCATQMRHLSILRSVNTNATDHEVAEYLMHCGVYVSCWDSDVPLGSILAYELWNREAGAPPFVAIDPPRIPECDVMGSEFLPLLLREPFPEFSRVPGPDRWALLAGQDAEWIAGRQQKGAARIAESRARSEKWMNSSWANAMDLGGEPDALRRSYGGRFGQNCLRARRLVQAGVAVVEVGLQGWDTHEYHKLRTRKLCGQLDAGLGTLIRDLAEKDFLKDTAVICCGEFGRSPKLNEGGGRDHWTKGFSVVLAGGSLAGGRVYGDTGPDGIDCRKPVPVHYLFATLFQACGVDGNRTYEQNGRKTKYVSQNGSTTTSGTPIRELF